jgi:hypothetical protein
MTSPARLISRNRLYAFLPAIGAILALTLWLGGTPVVAQDSPSASFQVTCTPDTFQPNEWVVIDCVTIVTSNSDDLAWGGLLSVMTAGGPIPDYSWVSLDVDGEQVPVGPGALSFQVLALQPGQSSKSELIGLLRMSEGTWQGEDSLNAGENELAKLDVRLTASDDAPPPPSDLSVTTTSQKTPSQHSSEPSSATFETVIRNESSSPVTYLKVTEQSDGGYVTSSDPEPSAEFGRDGVNHIFWDLSSFGRDSLGPGQSLSIRNDYVPADTGECTSIERAVVVEADSGDGIKRYGVPATEASVTLGDCDFGEGAPGADMPIAFGQGGEGPDTASSNPMWAAALLAMAGGGLVTTSMLLRWQSR